MKHKLFFLSLFISLQFRTSLAQNYEFRAIHFPSSTYGFIVGDKGLALRTSDAGKTWSPLVTGRPFDFQSVYFLVESIGMIGGDSKIFLVTIDAGDTWSPFTVPDLSFNYQITKIFFNSPSEGWFLAIDTSFFSSYSRIYHTTSFGGSWNAEALENDGYYTDISFQESSNRGVAVGDTSTHIIRYDQNNTWSQASSVSFPNQPQYREQTLYGAYYTPPNSNFQHTAFACGYGNASTNEPTIYLRTDDGGVSWNYLAQRSADQTFGTARRLFFTDPDNGIAIGTIQNGSFVSRTTDGEHFVPLLFNYKTNLCDIAGNGTDLWVIGSNCFLARSTDFGSTWKTVSLCPTNATDLPDEPVTFSLEQNYPNPFSRRSPTTIQFTLSPALFAANQNHFDEVRTTLGIYNTLGQKVATQKRDVSEPGAYTFLFRDDFLPAGMYLYTLTVSSPGSGGSRSLTKRMMILR